MKVFVLVKIVNNSVPIFIDLFMNEDAAKDAMRIYEKKFQGESLKIIPREIISGHFEEIH
jgi:hypothetical protein